ncbi:MAG: hypothetical protein HMLKMBBP_01784 [Planctomycetes bacterium]|nr:hypothetical protein [Planctomycetota bacterium]
MIPCLVVTADPVARDVISVGLEQTQSFALDMAEDAWALEMARSKPYRVIVVDADLQGVDAGEMLKSFRDARPDAELLMITRNRNQARHLLRDKQQLALYGFVHLPVERLEFFQLAARLLERVGGAPAAA